MKFAPILLLAAFSLGGLRYALAHLPAGPADLAWYNGKGDFRMEGWVAADPDRRDRSTLLRVRVTAVEGAGGWTPVRGLAQGMLPAGAEWIYGDRVILSGKPQTPPTNEEFSYRDYLAAQGVYTYLAYPEITRLEGRSGSWFLRQVYRLRMAGLEILARLYPAPEAQLLQGILLGVDENIPPEVVSSFQVTGIAHVVAISGFNMTVLSTLFMGLFGRFLSRWWAALSAALALAGYAVLVGGGASVVRAAVMCALALAAAQLGRAAGGVNALALAAGVMFLFNPNLPWDAGFQLSFAATLGLLLYAGPLQAWFSSLAAARLPAGWGARIAGPVGEYLLCTLAAQATTLPVIAWHFQRISLISLLANPLVLPAQPPLMILGGLSLLVGLFWEAAGRLLAWAGWIFAAWTVGVARALARLPGGEIALGPAGAGLVLGGVAALLLALLLREKLRALKLGAVLVLLPLIGVSAFAGRAALAGGDGRFHLVAFDLPGGPAYLLREPGGSALLIGGAESASRLEGRLGRWLPPGAGLAGLVVPAGADQKGLPAVVERFRPAWAFLCPDADGLKSALEEALREGAVQTDLLAPGRALNWGPARVEVLAAGPGQCALVIAAEDARILLPGAGSPADLDAVTVAAAWVVAVEEDWEGPPGRLLSLPPGGWLHIQLESGKMWVESGK